MVKSRITSPLGDIILVADEHSLVYSNWDEPECERKLQNILKTCSDKESPEDYIVLKGAEQQLSEYFEGRRKEFDISLNFKGTSFQKNVWRNLRNLKYGQTLSYKELAYNCGNINGFRAVAHACGLNPLAIIVPCHRVITSNGSLGGYTGGLDKKRGLLTIEGSLSH